MQMVQQILGHQTAKVHCRVFPLANGMRAIGIGHHGKVLVVAYQFGQQHLERLVVAVVIPSAVNDQQIPL